jgi:hypothetical protein
LSIVFWSRTFLVAKPPQKSIKFLGRVLVARKIGRVVFWSHEPLNTVLVAYFFGRVKMGPGSDQTLRDQNLAKFSRDHNSTRPKHYATKFTRPKHYATKIQRDQIHISLFDGYTHFLSDLT